MSHILLILSIILILYLGYRSDFKRDFEGSVHNVLIGIFVIFCCSTFWLLIVADVNFWLALIIVITIVNLFGKYEANVLKKVLSLFEKREKKN